MGKRRFPSFKAAAAMALALAINAPGSARDEDSRFEQDGWAVALSDEGCSMERGFPNGDFVQLFRGFSGLEELLVVSRRLTGVGDRQTVELAVRLGDAIQTVPAFAFLSDGVPAYRIEVYLRDALSADPARKVELQRGGAPLITLDFSSGRAALETLAAC